MKQKTVTLHEHQIKYIQRIADLHQEGDFSRMLRIIITDWEKKN